MTPMTTLATLGMLATMVYLSTLMVVNGDPIITSITGHLHTNGLTVNGTGFLNITGTGFVPNGDYGDVFEASTFPGAPVSYVGIFAEAVHTINTDTFLMAEPVLSVETQNINSQCVSWTSDPSGIQSNCFAYDVFYAPSVASISSPSCTQSGDTVIDCSAAVSHTFTIEGNDYCWGSFLLRLFSKLFIFVLFLFVHR
jgi:hypothetical protein